MSLLDGVMIATHRTPMAEPEEWRLIPGHSGYAASSLGRILRVGFFLLGQSVHSPGGYLGVGVRTDCGKRVTRVVHVLVAATFLGPRPVEICETAKGVRRIPYHVNHMDHGRTNNRLSNLEYATPYGNLIHGRMIREGRLPAGVSAAQAIKEYERGWSVNA